MAASRDSWLNEGIAAARSGQLERARACLLRVVEADERNVQAWYWLSRVVESPEEREICLENVLALDPGHTAVHAELANLRRRVAGAQASSLLSREAVDAAVPRTFEEHLISHAAQQPLPCPECGVPTGAEDRHCPACGRDLYSRERKREEHSIYSLALVAVWFALANYVWLALSYYYLFSGLSSAVNASPAARSTLDTLGSLLGLGGSGPSAPGPPLAPVLLAGGAVFLLSLLVAWGLYVRLRLFYWLTIGFVLLAPLSAVYQAATAETIPLLALAIQAVLFLLALTFAFLAHDEFAWVERRLDASLDTDVDSHSALYARGREHAGRGMWAKAAAHWSRAVALSPGHPDYRTALASAYINLHRSQQALEHLRVARQIEPDNPQVRELLESLKH
jgi:tetratricopeptide (TPR) repeat protein